MTKRLGRASAADIFWPSVVHYDALCSFYPRSVLLVLQRVFAWPNFSLLPNGFDAPFDGIFHKGENISFEDTPLQRRWIEEIQR